ncbi:hypothetical protein FQA39_LY18867 [Lamprigera yunnana]|nr:hypothetical protein FQA39_LY18867 [Lamprigera yunnana]
MGHSLGPETYANGHNTLVPDLLFMNPTAAGKNRNRIGLYSAYERLKGETVPVSNFYKEIDDQLKAQFKDKEFWDCFISEYNDKLDGLTIRGYINTSKARIGREKSSFDCKPHGGPQGIEINWGFQSGTQLFASRGYATLQVKFRISGGYGKEFQKAGYKQMEEKPWDECGRWP